MKSKLFVIFFMSILISIVYQSTSSAQDYATWGLPEGAKARFGKGGVWDVAYSLRGEFLAAAGSIGIWIYDTATYEELSLLTLHTGVVTSVAFSQDGKTLASGSEDSTVRLWDVKTGALLHTLTGHTAWVEDVAFSPNGNLLASAGGYYNDNTVRLWDVKTGALLHTLTGHTKMVTSVAFSPNGQMLASGSKDSSVRWWSVQTGTLLRATTTATETHFSGVTDVAFSPNGRLLISVGWGGFHVWNVETGELLDKRGATYGFSVAFSPNGQMLAIGHALGEVKYDMIGTGGLIVHGLYYPSISGDTGNRGVTPVWGASFNYNGNQLVTVAHDATIRVWHVNSIEDSWLLHTITGHTDAVSSVDFSPDGKIIANGNGDMYHKLRRGSNIENNTINLWAVETGKLQHTITTGLYTVSSVRFGPIGWRLASGGPDGTVRLWDANTGELERTFSTEVGWVWSVTFNPNGLWLAHSLGNTVYSWSVGLNVQLPNVIKTEHTKSVNSVAYSHDGPFQFHTDLRLTLASAGRDGAVYLWDAVVGLPALSSYIDHPLTVTPGRGATSVTFSHNDQLLASGCDDGSIYVWTMPTGKLRTTLTGHRWNVSSIAFSPNNMILASGSWDHTVRLWNAWTGKHLHAFIGHNRDVTSVAFSPDGRMLASGSADGTVLLWDLALPELKSLSADVDGNGVVNIQDLVLVAASFGATGENPADVNGDGQVDIRDLVSVAAAFGDSQ